MTEPPSLYDVTITVDRDRGHLPRPGRVRLGGRAGSISQGCRYRAHTVGQIISVVTIQAADQPVAVALAVVSEALSRPVASPTR